MSSPLRHVVVVGGGSAGWLTAALLAADHDSASPDGLRVTLIESPDVPTIGVGEGTWPTMRDTLRRIGVRETDFVRECDATFKQGSKFVRWSRDHADDVYHHPFVLPHGFHEGDVVAAWMRHPEAAFDRLVSIQPHLCDAGRAPKQLHTPEYAAVANYAYHLDAARLGLFLRRHATARLGVRHVADHVEGIDTRECGDIAGVHTRGHGLIEGDLFVDCTGMRSLLLGQHFGVERTSCRDVLFNDRALALQVRYPASDTPIACQTVSTAQANGWIWDIGLSARRGVGHVYSSAHTDPDAVEAVLRRYVDATGGAGCEVIAQQSLAFEPGYRRRSWHRNCVAIGLSSGFVEPLEASSLVLVELAATMLSDQLPATRPDVDIVAARFNDTFAYRWARVVEFLKLHYVLSTRDDSDYWRDHRDPASAPARLGELLALWRHQPPSRYDLHRLDEVFPAASYQYILYGMGFRPQRPARRVPTGPADRAEQAFRDGAALTRRMLPALPGHRELIDHIHTRGMSPV